MDVKTQLDSIVEQWNLLNHPFYQSWSAGDLPAGKLQKYAQEYGAFIRVVPRGWEILEDGETASEEMEHALLWDAFAGCFNTRVTTAALEETIDLIDVASESFSTPATAIGGLYAFEAQQPATARSKLEGLRLHYDIPAAGEAYFEVHADDEHEAVELLERMSMLDEKQQQQAVAACESVAKALWRGLDGIMEAQPS